MAYFDHASDAVRRSASSSSVLVTVAAALVVIVALGIADRIAGDWTASVAERMGQPSAATDWRGNSASLAPAR
ncbi:hypothetical protein [Fulvimarina sp. MAC3]|uniref:hypothetical protein n=1 Tax=Fulvimarina sp. MAC3 TaxID=3148887 RepID=UPI0031FBE6D5